MELSPEQYDEMTPLFACLDDKPQSRVDSILDRFSTLSEYERRILVDPATAEKIFQLTQEGMIPPSHAKAVSIIVCLIILGEVHRDQTRELLQKLGLSPEVVAGITTAIEPILNNAMEARIVNLTPPSMSELPPLTQQVPSIVPYPDSSKTPSRNVIDLRKTS